MTGIIGMTTIEWHALVPEKNRNEWEKQFQQLRDRFNIHLNLRLR